VDALSGEGDNKDPNRMSVATPLHLAVEFEDEDYDKDEVIVALLKAGADVNAEGGQGKMAGARPLHIAATYNDVRVMKLLKKHSGGKLQVDARARDGNTPLQVAASLGHSGAMSHLLNIGADPLKDDWLSTLLKKCEKDRKVKPESALPIPTLHGVVALRRELAEARREIEELKEQMKHLQAK
tara:strand:+ start:323 stop:871 length:549 start_codon:yes stop_codon:yes gene_type:complete